jgi:hypothetical protein
MRVPDSRFAGVGVALPRAPPFNLSDLTLGWAFRSKTILLCTAESGTQRQLAGVYAQYAPKSWASARLETHGPSLPKPRQAVCGRG